MDTSSLLAQPALSNLAFVNKPIGQPSILITAGTTSRPAPAVSAVSHNNPNTISPSPPPESKSGETVPHPGLIPTSVFFVAVGLITFAAVVGALRIKSLPYENPRYKRIANVALLALAVLGVVSFLARSVDRGFHELLDPAGLGYLVIAALVLIWPSISEFGKDGVKTRDDYWTESLQRKGEDFAAQITLPDEMTASDQSGDAPNNSSTAILNEDVRSDYDELSAAVPKSTDLSTIQASSGLANLVKETRRSILAALRGLAAAAGLSEDGDHRDVAAKLVARGVMSGKAAQTLNDIVDRLASIPVSVLKDPTELEAVLETARVVKTTLRAASLRSAEQRLLDSLSRRAEEAGLRVSLHMQLRTAGQYIEPDMVVAGTLVVEVKVRRSASEGDIEGAHAQLERLRRIGGFESKLLVLALPDRNREINERKLSPLQLSLAWTYDYVHFSGTDRARAIAQWLFIDDNDAPKQRGAVE